MSGRAVGEFLQRHEKIGLDTSVFIFQVEKNPKYIDLVNPIFRWLLGARAGGVTSTITMLEILVQPYRVLDQDRVDQFYALLSTYPRLEWIAPTLEIADDAARIRAQHRLSTPDAIQAATALAGQARGFVSNDPVFKRVAGLHVLILDELT